MTLWSIIGGIVCAFGATYLAGHAEGIRLERKRHVDERAEASRRQIARLESVVGPLDDSGEWEPNEADLRAAADAIAYDDRAADERGGE